MNNNDQIFELTNQLIPDLTSRKFSVMCGKSEGYYGSITAQKLELSRSALLGLIDAIEQIKVKALSTDTLAHTTDLDRLTSLIYETIAERTLRETSCKNLIARRFITEAISNLSYKQSSKYTPLPFAMI